MAGFIIQEIFNEAPAQLVLLTSLLQDLLRQNPVLRKLFRYLSSLLHSNSLPGRHLRFSQDAPSDQFDQGDPRKAKDEIMKGEDAISFFRKAWYSGVDEHVPCAKSGWVRSSECTLIKRAYQIAGLRFQSIIILLDSMSIRATYGE